MFGSINPTEIWKAHINTFRDYNTNQWLTRDLLFVFGSPILIALPITLIGVRLDKDIANVFTTSLSIFAGLLFNLLVLAHSLREVGADDKVKAHLLRSAYANISFSILLAVITIFFLSVYAVTMTQKIPYFFGALTLLTLYLSILFLFTLLIVLKRFHSILWKEMS